MSRLSDLLNDLSRAQRMNQPQIVKRSNDLGVPLSKGNVSRYLSGKHPEKPQHATLDAFAQVFGIPVEDLEAAATHSAGDPFQADPSADLLTPPQRTAVNEIIRLLAESNKGANHDREAESQQGPETSSQEHARTDRPEDGSTTRRGGPIVDLDQARRVKDDPAAFGDQPRRGDMDRRQREADEKPLEELLDLAADKGDRMDEDE